VDEAVLARVMHVVPLGAGMVAGAAVALLLIGYLLIYLLVFRAVQWDTIMVERLADMHERRILATRVSRIAS
jgi:hypothetical protein